MHDIRPAPDLPARNAVGQIRSIQVLRAVAALFVVAFHSTVLWHDKFSPRTVPWENGNAGVDIFFVISGFIMVVSSRRLLRQADGWRQFMKLRLIRIAPLYWLATVLKLAVILAVPAMALHTRPALWNSISSFLFIPARDAAGQIRPVLDAGWTLSFEMLFYLVFACAMLFRLAPLRLVAPVMAALALLSLVHPADAPAFTSLASPLVLEFVFGALAAQLFIRGTLAHLASPWMIVPAILGLLCAAFVPADGVWLRVAIWGGGAMLTLLGCVLAERWLDPLLPRVFEYVGEASYSLYLTHGFILPVAGLVIARIHLTGAVQETALVSLCMLASTAAALAVYRFVEMPVTLWLRTEALGRKGAFFEKSTKKRLLL
jgi:exopolysaccharide production protein ExoZ